jgi:DNA-binding transcriptional MerR regulator
LDSSYAPGAFTRSWSGRTWFGNTMKNIYLIKDLAKRSGYSTYTLKYYLQLGLIKEIGRSPETNFRYFDDSSFESLKRIRELQKQKLSLKEISKKITRDK